MVELYMAYHLKNFYLMMSHDCSYIQTLVICSCCDQTKRRKLEAIFFICMTETYFGCCCLDDIPEPLRELNDDFLQFGIRPAVKGSDP